MLDEDPNTVRDVSLSRKIRAHKKPKHLLKEHSYTFSFQPIYYITRIFGTTSFSIVYNANGEPQTSKVGIFDGMWFLVMICIHVASAYYFIHELLNLFKEPNEPLLMFISDYILHIVKLVLGALIIVMNMCTRFKLVYILQKLTIFDKEVSISFH